MATAIEKEARLQVLQKRVIGGMMNGEATYGVVAGMAKTLTIIIMGPVSVRDIV